MENLLAAGLDKDCPFFTAEAAAGVEAQALTAETAATLSDSEFAEYAARINKYLRVRGIGCARKGGF